MKGLLKGFPVLLETMDFKYFKINLKNLKT